MAGRCRVTPDRPAVDTWAKTPRLESMRIAILGGSGNAGRAVAELLATKTDVELLLGGDQLVAFVGAQQGDGGADKRVGADDGARREH